MPVPGLALGKRVGGAGQNGFRPFRLRHTGAGTGRASNLPGKLRPQRFGGQPTVRGCDGQGIQRRPRAFHVGDCLVVQEVTRAGDHHLRVGIGIENPCQLHVGKPEPALARGFDDLPLPVKRLTGLVDRRLGRFGELGLQSGFLLLYIGKLGQIVAQQDRQYARMDRYGSPQPACRSFGNLPVQQARGEPLRQGRGVVTRRPGKHRRQPGQVPRLIGQADRFHVTPEVLEGALHNGIRIRQAGLSQRVYRQGFIADAVGVPLDVPSRIVPGIPALDRDRTVLVNHELLDLLGPNLPHRP